ASVVGGSFGCGNGPEYTETAWTDRGTYRPVWCPLSSLATEPVVPAGVARLLMDAHASGWPETPVSLRDRFDR
ncbi:MAG TPA: hypothetical protein VD789_04355, partial [Thermomicrobiales bacterium]|nr:hypothetical protein [Thermomicrobiales bacterium]